MSIAVRKQIIVQSKEGMAMHTVDPGKRRKIDATQAPDVHETRREKALRWAFWILFLLATLCAFVWKTVYASIS